jgi:hypothetical protein
MNSEILLHNEINFWYDGKFIKKSPIYDVEYYKEFNIIVIIESDGGGFKNISCWDVSKIYCLNCK